MAHLAGCCRSLHTLSPWHFFWVGWLPWRLQPSQLAIAGSIPAVPGCYQELVICAAKQCCVVSCMPSTGPPGPAAAQIVLLKPHSPTLHVLGKTLWRGNGDHTTSLLLFGCKDWTSGIRCLPRGSSPKVGHSQCRAAVALTPRSTGSVCMFCRATTE